MPFLMITGRGDKESVIEAKGSGVSAYIRKPFSALQLEAKLRVLHMRQRGAA
jgi:DNA-binding response OmpR family regulator